ncbi:MAG: hypothetical protein V7605_235, partial [Acidimicrobiaceae bacterium]
PVASNPSAGPFVAAYTGARYAEPPSDLGPHAYDAANLLVERGGQGPGRDPGGAVIGEAGQPRPMRRIASSGGTTMPTRKGPNSA